jgi:hypothetical protein
VVTPADGMRCSGSPPRKFGTPVFGNSTMKVPQELGWQCAENHNSPRAYSRPWCWRSRTGAADKRHAERNRN